MLSLTVNGAKRDVKSAPDTPLLYVLRNELGVMTPKFGCGMAQCGACSVLLGDEELFLSFVDFPWFKSASIAQLCAIEQPSENHLYWPELDVDLSVESIRNPSAFPLVSVKA